MYNKTAWFGVRLNRVVLGYRFQATGGDKPPYSCGLKPITQNLEIGPRFGQASFSILLSGVCIQCLSPVNLTD